MRKNDHLSSLSLIDQSTSDPLFSLMILRCNRIIQHDAGTPRVKADFRQKVGECNGPLFSFAQYLIRF